MKNAAESGSASLVLALVLSLVASWVRGEAPAGDLELAKGKDQVRQGEYDAAIATLTEVVRRLYAVPDRDAETADAYLHLGIAYAGLGQISPAKSQFVQALKHKPTITPDPKTTPPTALEAFAAARREAADDGVLAAATQAKKKKSPRTKILVAGGVVGTAVGAALATSGGGAAIPPRVNFVPVSTSPLIQLLGSNPPPGSILTSGGSVSLSLQTANPITSTEEFHFYYVGEALTADGRVCLSGRGGPFGIGPGSTITATFGLFLKCTPPFTTESLEISLEDVNTGARPYHASYRGRFQAVP